MLAALRAAQQAGGDKRGQQSAALVIVKPKGGYGGYNDRYIDLRVDDAAEPIEQLAHLLDLHRLYFVPPKPADIIKIDDAIGAELVAILTELDALAKGPSEILTTMRWLRSSTSWASRIWKNAFARTARSIAKRSNISAKSLPASGAPDLFESGLDRLVKAFGLKRLVDDVLHAHSEELVENSLLRFGRDDDDSSRSDRA